MNAPITNIAYVMAEEEACNDVEQFGSWLNCVSEGREPSVFWTSISTPDLVRKVILGTGATEKQYAEACKELRRRYLAEYRRDIEQRAMELML